MIKVERHGLGFQGTILDQGVELMLDRLYESKGDLTGELTISRTEHGVLYFGRVNLVSATARKTTGKDIEALPGGAGKGVDWGSALNAFCIRVLEMHRAGEPVRLLDEGEAVADPPYLLRPLLLEGASTILFGKGGTGKSTLAATIAVGLSTGRDPMPGWHVVRPARVLVLDWEDSEENWKSMTAEAARGLGVPRPRIWYQHMDMPLDQAVHRIAAIVTSEHIDMVIVDSVENALRNQGDGGGINEPIKRLFGALRQLGTSNLLIDHVSKASLRGEEETDGQPIGGTAKTNRARRTFELREAGEPGQDVIHLSLINRKANRGRKDPPVGIQVRRSQGALVLEPEKVHLTDPVTARATKLEDSIREALGKGQRLSAAEIVGVLRLGGADPERTVRQTMSRKPNLFGMATQKKGPAIWFLVDTHHGGNTEQMFRNNVPPPETVPQSTLGAEQNGLVPVHVPQGGLGEAGGVGYVVPPPTPPATPPPAPGPDRSPGDVPPFDDPGWDELMAQADQYRVVQ